MKEVSLKVYVLFQYRHYSDFLKKVSWLKFFRKRRIFCKIFCSVQNFLELQCLVDDSDEVDMQVGNEKKNNLLHNIYILFFLKNCYKWLKLMICNSAHKHKKALSTFYHKKYFS